MSDNIQTVNLSQGDVILMTVPADISSCQIEYIKQAMNDKFPNQNIIVLSDNIRVTIIRHE